MVKTAFGETQRVMLKQKIPEFDETRNQKGSKQKGTGVFIFAIIFMENMVFLMRVIDRLTDSTDFRSSV